MQNAQSLFYTNNKLTFCKLNVKQLLGVLLLYLWGMPGFVFSDQINFLFKLYFAYFFKHLGCLARVFFSLVIFFGDFYANF